LWDAETGLARRNFEGHEGRVFSIAFSSNGQYILTGASDWTARLWDVESGRALQTFGDHAGGADRVAISPDGTLVFIQSDGRAAGVWKIHPIILASAGEQVNMACNALRSIGMTRYSEAVRQRFPSLQGVESPC
jgi:WD40 repeat protein